MSISEILEISYKFQGYLKQNDSHPSILDQNR